METNETNVYVGKIPESISDAQIQKILKTCGKLKQWKRTSAVGKTKEFKKFGFATFLDLEGVLAAMRVLDGMQLFSGVDDERALRNEQLLLNVNQATKKAAEKYNEERGGVQERDEEEDRKRRELIKEIVRNEGNVDDDDDDDDAKNVDALEFSADDRDDDDYEEIGSKIGIVPTTTTTTTKSSQEKIRNAMTTVSVLPSHMSTNKSANFNNANFYNNVSTV